MAGKETEGGNLERRQKAREAREQGKLPSELGVTTGGSRHRHHLRHGGRDDHVERLEGRHQGKQETIKRPGSKAKPRSRPEGPPSERS